MINISLPAQRVCILVIHFPSKLVVKIFDDIILTGEPMV